MATISSIRSRRIAAAQESWHEKEMLARAAFALTRLDSLDSLALNLTDADAFDAAYAIWDDYIDGRRDDERIDEATAAELTEAAMIFARVLVHLGNGPDAVELAKAAWGRRIFEVFLFETPGRRFSIGKFGWYPNESAVVVTRSAVECVCGQTHPGTSDTYTSRGLVRVAVRHARPVALHPVFGVRS